MVPVHRYHNSRFYGIQSSAAIRSNSSYLGVQTSKNIGVITIAAANPRKHYANIKVRALSTHSLNDMTRMALEGMRHLARQAACAPGIA